MAPQQRPHVPWGLHSGWEVLVPRVSAVWDGLSTDIHRHNAAVLLLARRWHHCGDPCHGGCPCSLTQCGIGSNVKVHGWGGGSTTGTARLASTLPWPQPTGHYNMGLPSGCCVCIPWRGQPPCMWGEDPGTVGRSLHSRECHYWSVLCWWQERIMENDGGYIEGRCHNCWATHSFRSLC